jgi:HAD superfamily hydrolase (TIGR01549 family)
MKIFGKAGILMKKKNIFAEFETLVDQFKVISFDAFDTLISRKVDRPTDVFKILEQKNGIKNFASDRIKAEIRARKKLTGRIEDLSLEDIYQELNCDTGEKLMENEIAEEKNLCFRNENGYKLYTLAHTKNKTIIAVSDMYLPVEIISDILTSAGYTNLKYLFLSNEYGKVKGTGNLFSCVLEELEISHREILHIGDNYFSDILGAEKAGIQGLYFNVNKSHVKNAVLNFLYRVKSKLTPITSVKHPGKTGE